MVNDRDFNDLIAQVNKKFAQLDAKIERLEKELDANTASKEVKKKVDK